MLDPAASSYQILAGTGAARFGDLMDRAPGGMQVRDMGHGHTQNRLEEVPHQIVLHAAPTQRIAVEELAEPPWGFTYIRPNWRPVTFRGMTAGGKASRDTCRKDEKPGGDCRASFFLPPEAYSSRDRIRFRISSGVMFSRSAFAKMKSGMRSVPRRRIRTRNPPL